MLPFPLGYSLTHDQVRADLEIYEPMYAESGPAMTASISVISWLLLANESIAAMRFESSMQHIQPPFQVWTESKSPNQHPSLVDEGCSNFVTGAGGFLQS